jgi:hypothetical protein
MHTQRPVENYQVQLNVISIRPNNPYVTFDKFMLNQPRDTQLQELK